MDPITTKTDDQLARCKRDMVGLLGLLLTTPKDVDERMAVIDFLARSINSNPREIVHTIRRIDAEQARRRKAAIAAE
jgi:hypothetical protein